MNLGEFIDNVQGSHRPEGGGVLPAPLLPLGERRQAPPPAPLPPGGAGRRHTEARPSPSKPTGAPPSSARWAPARPSSPQPPRTWRASSAFSWCWGRLTWFPSGSGRWSMTVPGAPRRHRQVHHRPGAAPLLHRLRSPLRHYEQREGEAVLPLEGRRHTAVGHVAKGTAGAGRGDGGALPGPLLPRLHRAGRGQRRRAPYGRGPEPPQATPAPTAAPPSGRPTSPAPPATLCRTT